MLKKIGLPFLAMAALLMVVPAQKANAAVRFGVVVGGPVYAYPAYPGPYAYPYSDPYYNPYPSYVAPAPGYVYGYGGWRGNPRGTAEKRPMRDTSKPANGTETGQALLYRAEPPFSNPFSLF
jgi:hypothetical protein